MPEPKEAAEIILRDEWDASNTSISSAPAIHTGNYDQGSEDPQVTITTVSETAPGAGTTGISAQTGGGALVQDSVGRLQIDCWSDRQEALPNPKQLTREMAEEVRRILLGVGTDVRTKLSGTKLDGTDLIQMTPRTPPAERSPETDRTPVVYGYLIEAGYYYKATE
jgi:hypothetical protein